MNIKIWLDENINLYTVEVGNASVYDVYECLSKDEVLEVVKQELENAD